nr:salicylic acid-binding protein 2-like [Tanacetum cinerariifolium]
MNSSDSVAGMVSRCSSPIMRESTGSLAGTEVDNHNQIENRFHRNHPSKSRMWDVEDAYQLHTARTYTIDKPVILSGIATLYNGGGRLTGQMVGVGGGRSGAEMGVEFAGFWRVLWKRCTVTEILNEKVVLVGYSLGGMSISLAMEKTSEKISLAVFLSAFMPDYVHKPSFVLNKPVLPAESYLDTQFSPYGENDAETSILFGPKILASNLYQVCSKE